MSGKYAASAQLVRRYKPSSHDVLSEQLAHNRTNVGHVHFVDVTVDTLFQRLPRQSLELCRRLVLDRLLHETQPRRRDVRASRLHRERVVRGLSAFLLLFGTKVVDVFAVGWTSQLALLRRSALG